VQGVRNAEIGTHVAPEAAVNLTISRKGLILVSVPLLFQLVFLVLVGRMQEKNAQAQFLARHAQEVITQINAVRADVLAAQSELRGYALTGKPAFADSYRDHVRTVPAKLDRLQELVADNPAQQTRAANTRASVERLLAWYAEMEALVPRSSPKQLKARVNDPSGHQMLTAFQAETDAFLREEQRLNDERSLTLEDTRWQLNVLLFAGGLGTFLCTVVLAGVFMRGISGRVAALAANARRLGRGEELAPPLRGRDEVAALDRTFHEMADALAAAARREREYLATLEERVAERTAELTEANRQLLEKNGENEMFVYSVSHDLRSPLVNLQGFSQELQRTGQELRALLDDPAMPEDLRRRGLDVLDRDMDEATHFILAAVKRLGSIIEALLRLSRAGRVDYQYQRVEVADVVGRVAEALGGTVAGKRATLTIGPLPPAWGDAAALEQVFANLLGNALNYLDPARPGRVEVGAAADAALAPGLHVYYVRDNGLGIAAAYHGRIFQVFQRAHLGVAPGEGMGLAIVRRIVERHRGEVWVESREGVGSTFYVALPAQPPAVNGSGVRPRPVPAFRGGVR
jgi:signal transduction histidine kinase